MSKLKKRTSNNLELELYSSTLIVDKCRESPDYCQALYAALCNNKFYKIDVWSILSDDHWSCSWRYAGDIVARLHGRDSYIDWYCSGISIDYQGAPKSSVPEGTITQEIKTDLKYIGWAPK